MTHHGHQIALHQSRRKGLLRPRGFSLIELLVVVAIIGLLASYVGPRLFGQVGKSEREVARAQIDAFGKALVAYRLDTGRFPSTAEGLQALVSSTGKKGWRGPYLDKDVPTDPWGEPYAYQSPGQNGDYDLMSLGPDRRRNGSGDNADITSWQ